MSTESPFAAIYPELRTLAHARLSAGRHTLLDTTALVHEFYLRLAETGNIPNAEWPQFLHYASRSMRNIIIDAIRRRRAVRHGGDARRVELDDVAQSRDAGEEEILAVHQALDQLEAIDERMARIVEMRYFGGMTETEIAECLGLTERTIRREWQKARALLAEALGG